jgi:transposase
MYTTTMAHFHVKRKNGRPYLYVREIARVNGKPTVVSQVYIGSPDRVAVLASGGGAEASALRVEEFGSLWLAAQLDADIGLAGLVDQVVGRTEREKGPSVGEYFLYAVFNRMVDATSKHRLPDWYRGTAIQQIRPVDIDALSSRRYWEKWERVSETALDDIGQRFFARLCALERPSADCLLFDTTNYFTFMASDTPSELLQRGNNKAGRHNLRQIGLALLVDRTTRLPLYYRAYPGNLHDSKLFGQVLDQMFSIVTGLAATKERLTVVIDKGMNADGNYEWIDAHNRVHFVTSYSTYFASELAATALDHFEPVDLARNRRLSARGRDDDRLIAYRTTREYWGKERTVVVTHNPATARKQDYTLDAKLETLRNELLAMRAKVNDGAPHWRDSDVIGERYIRLCEHLHLPTDLYQVELTRAGGALSMRINRDQYRIGRLRACFGRNIIITDNRDWSTADIVQASLDRWIVEDRFRASKDDELVSVSPLRHWTDAKIRCHLMTCMVALTYLRRLERRLQAAGIQRSAATAMADMRRLHSVLTIGDGRRKPIRRIEQPTKTQAEVLRAFGHHVDPQGVLQPITQ